MLQISKSTFDELLYRQRATRARLGDSTRCVASVLAACGLVLSNSTAHAQVQSLYFIPLPENEILESLDDVNSAADDPVQTYISITLSGSCTVYWDE